MSKMEPTRRMALAGILAVSVSMLQPSIAQQPGSVTATKPAGVLKAADTTNLMPAQVFFRGQSATVQMRNSGGVRYSDGTFTLMGLVDTSGYSSGIQDG